MRIFLKIHGIEPSYKIQDFFSEIAWFCCGSQKFDPLKIEFKYFKCSSNGTDCVETKLRYHFDDFGDFELKREKRSIWTPWGKREPICRLDCTCDPDVSSNIDQASAIKQKSEQKQKVTVQQAFGIGSVLAVIGMSHLVLWGAIGPIVYPIGHS